MYHPKKQFKPNKMSRMNNCPSIKTFYLYKRLLTYVRPYLLILLLGILANIIYSCIDAGFTYLTRPFLDKSFIHVDEIFVWKIPLVVLIGITLRGFISAMGSYCMTWVARSVVKVLRQEVFAHIIELPVDFYDKATSGQMLSKILFDVEQVAQVSAEALTDFVQNVCLVIGLVSVMMLISWQLSLIFLLISPFVGCIVTITNKRVRRISHKVQKTMGEVTEIASETIDGYQVVRIFGGAQYEKDKFNQATELSRQNDMKVALNKAFNVFGVQTVIALGISLIILSTIKLSSVLVVTAGSFLAIILAMFQLIRPMKVLTTLNATFQKGLAGAESVFNLLDITGEPKQGIILKQKASGRIQFKGVSYAYRPGQPVLENLNFTIEAGQSVALVGHSGSGKTTVASLLPRFYELEEGIITLDDIPINQLNLVSLRQQIGFVSQQITLFNDTLANNIAYARANVCMQEIITAAKLAHAHEFISQLPEGYNTVIGENGVLLSGGQRQRIAIARAILKDAPILILDEATSALDSESEQYIQTALDRVMINRTSLVIAHRLSTIKKADKIIVLQHGRIVEEGKHAALIELNGHYAQLYRVQQVDRIQEEIIL